MHIENNLWLSGLKPASGVLYDLFKRLYVCTVATICKIHKLRKAK